MSRARVAVLKVVSKQLSVTAAATQYGYSRQHLHKLIARYRIGGLDAVEPGSRRPKTNSAATSDVVRERVIDLRLTLTKVGLDAGPITIGWHLENEGHQVPAVSTIRRRAGRMHHLGIGAKHRNKRILAIADDDIVTVIELTTGEILSTHTIDPDRSYWRNQQRTPGRWPGAT